ncbi:unnamed protein product [Ilex paraguariensis]|uniref:ATP synthase subunit 9, mitochondrial n=1 Tax=Ilex paraguariensis TaxID=185542 RepID=A0ABC8RVM2_9AQUA
MKKRDENSQLEMLKGAKSMGVGATTIASARAAISIGNVFSSSIHSMVRNPSLAKQSFGYAILGFALTEAIASFAPIMAFLISSVFRAAHNPWSTTGFDFGHIDDDDRLSFMHLYKAKAIIVGVVENLFSYSLDVLVRLLESVDLLPKAPPFKGLPICDQLLDFCLSLFFAGSATTALAMLHKKEILNNLHTERQLKVSGHIRASTPKFIPRPRYVVTSLAGPLIRNGQFVSLNLVTGLAPSDIRRANSCKPLVKTPIHVHKSGKGKARVSTIQSIKRETEVGLLDISKDDTRIQPYPPKQEDVFFDAVDVFLEKVVARFRQSTLIVCFPLAIGLTIWWAGMPEFVIDWVPECCLDHKWIKIWKGIMEISIVLKQGVLDENGTIGGIPMTDLVNSESREYFERTTFDPLDIKKRHNRKVTIAVLFVAYLALALSCEEALQVVAHIPVEELMV